MSDAGRDGHELTLTTLSRPLPASVRMALRDSQHALVWSAMEPSTRLPSLSAGIWPETKMWAPALMAWVLIVVSVGLEKDLRA